MKNPNEINRFEKVDAARKKAMTEIKKPITHEDRVAQRAEQRSKWINHSGDKHGPARLDDATIAAKEAFEKDKAARKAAASAPKAAPIGDQEAHAISRMWAEQKGDFVGTPYNAQVLADIVAAFRLPITFAGLDQAFEYGVAHRHFETKGPRHRGQPAPVPFVPPQSTIPVEPVVIKPVRIQTEVPADEFRNLRSMPFDQLRERARQGMSAYNPDKRKGN
jgi:hypothetical protein